jgi:diguanylate cyclase (GGDEF)-like protein
MLSIDLDRFKLVNEALGHAAGDRLLQQAAARLLAVTTETDTVARIGGDEFAILCGGRSLADAQQLCDHVVAAFQAPFEVDGEEAMVTASVGVAVADSAAGASDLLRDADMAMHQAKHSGRNATESFTHEMRDLTRRRVDVETHLRSALEHDDLRLHFQPILDTSGTLRGFEGLARWTLAGRGTVPPTEFIPVAESTGLIGSLTDWALDVGLQALARWRDARPNLNLTLAINIAASQMGDESLRRTIDVALKRNRLPAGCLCLEITESALVADGARSSTFLQGLRKQGVLLSIDDFGTGYSSLSYLTKLPVHELKVDRSLIAGLPSRARDMAVVASVVGLAHQLGLRALAEGVESEEQLAAVNRLGCDAIQGFLLARPMPADEVDLYLAALDSSP